MKPIEAAGLFRQLRAAYPATKIEGETSRLWLAELRKLDPGLGGQAVAGLIASSRFWPSLAELHEQVAMTRERIGRERREAERREADRAYEEMPRPPLRSIPAAAELIDRFLDPPPALDFAADGACGECGRRGRRFQFGRFQLCSACARRRLRARDLTTTERRSA